MKCRNGRFSMDPGVKTSVLSCDRIDSDIPTTLDMLHLSSKSVLHK
jgi:hypothetical protein